MKKMLHKCLAAALTLTAALTAASSCSEREDPIPASPVRATGESLLTVRIDGLAATGRKSAPRTRAGSDIIFPEGNTSTLYFRDGSSTGADEYPGGLTRDDAEGLADQVVKIELSSGVNGTDFDLTPFRSCEEVKLPESGQEVRLPASVRTVRMETGSVENLYLYGVNEVNFVLTMDYYIVHLYHLRGYRGPDLAETLMNAGVTVEDVRIFRIPGVIDEASGLSGVDVLVFYHDGDRAGELESAVHVTPDAEQVSASLKVSSGVKDVLVLGNMPASFVNGITTLAGYTDAVKRYEWNRPDALIMDALVNGLAVRAASVSCSATLTRWCSRVSIGTVINQLPASYGALTLSYIYLNPVNFASSGTDYRNATASNPLAVPWSATLAAAGWTDVLPLLSSENLAAEIPNGGNASPYVTLFGFPNTAASAASADATDQVTKLVIRAQVGGQTCWYPIALSGMERNKSYEINSLTITRPGSSDENTYLSTSVLEVSITVRDWATGEITGSFNGTVDAEGNITF